MWRYWKNISVQPDCFPVYSSAFPRPKTVASTAFTPGGFSDTLASGIFHADMKLCRIVLALASVALMVSCESPEPEVVYTFSVVNVYVPEGNAPAVFNVAVKRSGSSLAEHEIDYAFLASGSARAGEDFEVSSGKIIFEKGSANAVIPLTVSGDGYFELTEDFQMEITDADRKFTFTLFLNNDDEPEQPASDADGFITPQTYPSMDAVWADEFNGTALNSADWNTDLGNGCDQGICGWGNNELESYAADTSVLKIKDGRMAIRARKVNDSYFSARINTRNKKQFTFGRIDMRARLPKGKGIWPAFWMLGSSIETTPWPKCGEIDIMELVGDQPDVVHGTLHYDRNGYATSTGSTSLTGGDFSQSFHIFSLVWEQDIIKWYVDNKLFKTFQRTGTGAYPFNEPFYILVNVAVGGRWPGNPDTSTVFPQTMEVDYIRVFR